MRPSAVWDLSFQVSPAGTVPDGCHAPAEYGMNCLVIRSSPTLDSSSPNIIASVRPKRRCWRRSSARSLPRCPSGFASPETCDPKRGKFNTQAAATRGGTMPSRNAESQLPAKIQATRVLGRRNNRDSSAACCPPSDECVVRRVHLLREGLAGAVMRAAVRRTGPARGPTSGRHPAPTAPAVLIWRASTR